VGRRGRAVSGGLPDSVRTTLEHELRLIEKLHYAPYFLTVNSIIRFARSNDILCQGRGSAANSAVCYVLGITSIDPDRNDLLFERFVSEERREPLDIDVDFEHERREMAEFAIFPRVRLTRPGLWYHLRLSRDRSRVVRARPRGPASVRRGKSSSIRRTSSGSTALRGETFAVSPPRPGCRNARCGGLARHGRRRAGGCSGGRVDQRRARPVLRAGLFGGHHRPENRSGLSGRAERLKPAQAESFYLTTISHSDMSQIDLLRRHYLDAITSERWTASDWNRWTPQVRYAWTASLESAAWPRAMSFHGFHEC
jgi:hypothetical protein